MHGHTLSDLRNSGVADVCIVGCDGLKGRPEAIRTTGPDAEMQTCVVQLIRNVCATPTM